MAVPVIAILLAVGYTAAGWAIVAALYVVRGGGAASDGQRIRLVAFALVLLLVATATGIGTWRLARFALGRSKPRQVPSR